MGKNLAFEDDGYLPSRIEETLKEYFERRFDKKIVYVNATYKIDDFYKVSETYIELTKRKGVLEYFLKEKDMTREQYMERITGEITEEDNKDFPKFKKGKLPCSAKEIINPETVDAEIKECDE